MEMKIPPSGDRRYSRPSTHLPWMILRLITLSGKSITAEALATVTYEANEIALSRLHMVTFLLFSSVVMGTTG